MQPSLILTPFAENAASGNVDTIPNTLGPNDPPQAASWQVGFPQVTMTPLAAGGIPPRGQSFNGVLKAISQHTVFVGGGGMYAWNSQFASKYGYSKGAALARLSGEGHWISIVDGNITDPDDGGAGWMVNALISSSGVNTTIARLAGLTTAITVSQGGTGATTAAAARTNIGAAPLDSPKFTGVPEAPTPAVDDNSKNLATTEFVQSTVTKLKGRLLRTSVYTLVGGVQMVAVNGGSPSSAGASSFTPLAIATAVKVKVQAAGGGSSGTWTCNGNQVSAGGGGGGGGYAEGWYTSLSGPTTVVVGVGGVGATANSSASGGTGTASSFGSLLSCPGGIGSINASEPSVAAGINGGTAETAAPSGSNILFSVRGAPGVYGYQMAGVAGTGWGGAGGYSQFGAGRAVLGSSIYPGAPGLNWGAGAAGAFTPPSGAGQPGAKGADGIVIIEEYS